MRTFPVATSLAAALLLAAAPVSFAAMGAATAPAQLPMKAPVVGIGSDPAVQSEIARYYAAHAQEGPRCGPVTMVSLLSAPTIAGNGASVTVHVNYTFASTDPQSSGMNCSGMAIRDFTLSPGASGWTVRSMSEAEPA
jgi:hypothetical protein